MGGQRLGWGRGLGIMEAAARKEVEQTLPSLIPPSDQLLFLTLSAVGSGTLRLASLGSWWKRGHLPLGWIWEKASVPPFLLPAPPKHPYLSPFSLQGQKRGCGWWGWLTNPTARFLWSTGFGTAPLRSTLNIHWKD